MSSQGISSAVGGVREPYRLLDLRGSRCLIDDADYVRLGSRTVYLGANGYAYFSTHADGPQTLHAFIMGRHPGKHIDHINGDKLDNRRANLRVVSPRANQVNRKRLNRNNVSGIRGVQKTGQSMLKPWRAQITVGGRNLHLGLFETEAEATAARRVAERLHFGEVCP